MSVFEVPWGSESICYWCKKNGKCELYAKDPEIPFLILPAGTTPLTNSFKGAPKIRFTQIHALAAMQHCPIKKFDPDYAKLPDTFKDCAIVERKETTKNDR